MKVLLVDDSSDVLAVLKKMIQNIDSTIEILTGSNGLDAIKHYEKEGDSIDLMIIDQHMPGINGVDAIKTIRKSHPKSEIVLLTAYRDDLEIETELDPKVLPGHVVILLSKPAQPKMLESIIRSVRKN